MLGGSSGLNFLAWTRPHEADMTSIAAMAGKGGSAWDWKHMLAYFKKVRRRHTAFSAIV